VGDADELRRHLPGEAASTSDCVGAFDAAGNVNAHSDSVSEERRKAGVGTVRALNEEREVAREASGAVRLDE